MIASVISGRRKDLLMAVAILKSLRGIGRPGLQEKRT